ncbi:S9 family peptidase [Microlunatus parietis]|uniref:Dienelactone hydrolase n=1 Tax=Microlunatus parietis TaxID=682979 RepID=A0A7Y9I2Q7_9ACTN|nr:prolyl oligopeptidase family serine peptidase [Microlunatus parietis]NYE68916.1 dienelactone hydrolase [Microlunatus parietis]
MRSRATVRFRGTDRVVIQEPSGWRMLSWPDGRLLADGTGQVIDGPVGRVTVIDSGILIMDGVPVPAPGPVSDAAWDRDGFVAIVEGRELWSLPAVGPARLLHRDPDPLRSPVSLAGSIGFVRSSSSRLPGVILEAPDVRRPLLIDRSGGRPVDRMPAVDGWVDAVVPSPVDPERLAFQHTVLPGPYTFRLGLLDRGSPGFPLPDKDLRSTGAAPAWSPDGSVVAVAALQGIRGGIAGCGPDGSAPRWLAPPEGVHASPAPAPGGGLLSVWGDLATRPAVVLTTPAGRAAWTSLQDGPDWWPERPPRLIRWRSGPDEVEGLLLTPPGPGPYPLVIDLHGGPDNMTLQASLSSYAVPLDSWLRAGFAVFAPDYRDSGILGFAAKRAAGRFEPGARSSHDDVIAGLDQLIADGVAAPGRVHLFGFSMGGLVGGHVIARDHRIRSAAFWDPAGVDPYATDNAIMRRQFSGSPTEVPQVWQRISLQPLASRTTIPVLIMSSGDPGRLPGRTHARWSSALPHSEFRSFPAEGHTPSPEQRTEIVRQAVDWFGRS